MKGKDDMIEISSKTNLLEQKSYKYSPKKLLKIMYIYRIKLKECQIIMNSIVFCRQKVYHTMCNIILKNYKRFLYG